MTISDRLALTIAILAVFITAWIAIVIFEELPHLEDEYAYIWSAQTISAGHLMIPSPPEPKNFLVPFVVDHQGQRFSKYPLGWPALLSLGERFDLRTWINPLLAGLGIWLIYRLAQKVFGDLVGLLAAGLTLTSPFFLMNSSVLLSHPWGLVLSAAFTLFWLDVVDQPKVIPGWLPPLGAGLTLGALILSRPLTALGLGIPFGIHGLFLIIRGDHAVRVKIFTTGFIVLFVGSLHFLWQYALTGNPWCNPYTLWWPYDRLGFGPGYGVTEQGHSFSLAWQQAKRSLNAGYSDLFGWGKFSWLFLPFGMWAGRKRKKSWLIITIFPTLVTIYAAYWVGSWLFGPRYYYETLPVLVILSAAGIAYLAGWKGFHTKSSIQPKELHAARPIFVAGLVALLIGANLIYYIPGRIGSMKGLFGTTGAQLTPFLSADAQNLTPALVVVHAENWRDYSVLLELSDPLLESPFIFTYSRGVKEDAAGAAHFPDRNVWHYYPDDPFRFYTAPRQ